jgi:hypothetical protein
MCRQIMLRTLWSVIVAAGGGGASTIARERAKTPL